MRLLIIRHGDPDYKNDTLTEKGWREAECLADMLCAELAKDPDAVRKANQTADTAIDPAGAEESGRTFFYCSPYGRARATASVTLERLGQTAEVMPWLREFDALVYRPDDPDAMHNPWDWLPQDWTRDPRLYQKDHWFENEYLAAYNVGEEYCKVTKAFDALLAKHGYRREGGYYRAERPNKDTIVIFSHFGCGALLLSHLWGVSPMVVWHNLIARSSSVTTLVTEERRRGIATFRMLAYGETKHLYVRDEPPSFSGRFCECFDDDTRHD
jgi:probable phosphoglycerate mutase